MKEHHGDRSAVSPRDAVLPTVVEYLPRVVAAAGPGARRAYGTYWDRMAAAWPKRPLGTITASDVEALKQAMIASAVSRHNSRNGRHAGEHVIAAARAFYRRAIADGLIDAAGSPAHRVAKRRRLPGTRRAFNPASCVRLTEEGSTIRWQPITLDLADHLREHADARGAVLPTELRDRRNGRTAQLA